MDAVTEAQRDKYFTQIAQLLSRHGDCVNGVLELLLKTHKPESVPLSQAVILVPLEAEADSG